MGPGHTTAAMLTTPTPAIEQLPTNIPQLEPDGTNWAIFSMRFKEAMQATRRWGYFSGTIPQPTPADPDMPDKAEKQAMETWDLSRLRGALAHNGALTTIEES
jgi:hypothetical protein